LSARIPVRTTKWAYRGHRIGVLAIPVLIIGVLGSRFDYFGELETIAILGGGFLGAFLAVTFATRAIIDIWTNGDLGLGAALGGLFFGALGFAPALVLGAAVLIYPQITDVSSDIIEPPIISVHGDDDAKRIADASTGAVIIEDLFSLPLQMPIDQVYLIIQQIIEARGWMVVRDEPPGDGRTTSTIEVVTRTPILRLRDRATIRLTHFQEGTLVDMRSMTLRGRHDFGANLRRLHSFFDDIEATLEAAQSGTGSEESEEPG